MSATRVTQEAEAGVSHVYENGAGKTEWAKRSLSKQEGLSLNP